MRFFWGEHGRHPNQSLQLEWRQVGQIPLVFIVIRGWLGWGFPQAGLHGLNFPVDANIGRLFLTWSFAYYKSTMSLLQKIQKGYKEHKHILSYIMENYKNFFASPEWWFRYLNVFFSIKDGVILCICSLLFPTPILQKSFFPCDWLNFWNYICSDLLIIVNLRHKYGWFSLLPSL